MSFGRKAMARWNKISHILFEKGKLHYRDVAFILGVSPTQAINYCDFWARSISTVEYEDGYLIYKGEEEKEGE